jgi:hypothetical protein
MPKNTNPCYVDGKDCTKRTSTCHGECPEYLEFFNERVAHNAMMCQKKYDDGLADAARINALHKIKMRRSK